MTPSGRVARVKPERFDRAVVDRVSTAATAHDGRAPLNEETRLALDQHGLRGAALYVTGDDGFALLRGSVLSVVVRPDARGRGLGTALLAAALADHDRQHRDMAVTAWSHGNHPAAARLAASHGFTATRELWLMRRPPGPVDVVPPGPGVVLRTFVPGQDEQAFLEVNAAAFTDHPEQGGLTLDGLRARMAEPWFDPAGFFVAERDGRVLGFHWTKVEDDVGEVYVVGVSPAAQGLGVGRALVTAGLAHLQPREVLLYVEAANRAAIALYESVGFTHARSDTDVQYTRPGPVPPAGARGER